MPEHAVPAKIIHPLHTDGPETVRPRFGCQFLILVLPFFVCAIWANLPIGIETEWRRLPSAILLVFGLAVLLWQVLYLTTQYTTRIQLLDHLLVASVFSSWWPLRLDPQALRGFRRQSLTAGEKRRLQFLVGGLTVLIGLGGLGAFGFAVAALIFLPGKVRTEAALSGYILAALALMLETIVYGLAALSIIPTAWRIWQSDSVLLIWRHPSLGCLGWLFGPADLRVFAKQIEIDTLEAWLTERQVPKL